MWMRTFADVQLIFLRPSLPIVLMMLCVTASSYSTARGDDVRWKRIKLDEQFRSEGVAAADINRDGLTDVFAGDVWYEAPDWKVHALRPVGNFVAGQGYSNSFVNSSLVVLL